MTNLIAAGVATEVRVSVVDTERDAREVAEVLARIWATPASRAPVSPELAWALAHSGNYVALARSDGEVIGAAVAFRSRDEQGDFLHSHIAGVLPEWQGASVGFALKQHQRSWTIDTGLDRIEWTFDPLVGRNAYFNVVKLGAQLTRYYVDFYGDLDDGINAGDETDRCLVTWLVTSSRADRASRGDHTDYDIEAIRAAGGKDTLTIGNRNQPILGATDAAVRLVQTPRDILELRRDNAEVALAWRQALRQVLTAAFADGLEVVGVTRDSWYVVASPDSKAVPHD